MLPLPPGFAEFLLQDGVVLPPSFREAAQGTAADDSWSDQSEEDDSDSGRRRSRGSSREWDWVVGPDEVVVR